MADYEPIVTDWLFVEPGDSPRLEPGWHRLAVGTGASVAFAPGPRDGFPPNLRDRMHAEDARLEVAGWFG
jgi:hypothetical protein